MSLNEKNISELQQIEDAVNDKEIKINKELEDRDHRISNLTHVISLRDAQISNLTHKIERIYLSKSWRLMSPFRWIGHSIRKVILFLKSSSPKNALDKATAKQDPSAAENLTLVESTKFLTTAKTILDKNKQKPEILFVSHEASRTGAPVFLLKVAKQLKNQLDASCTFLLCSGGELENDFRDIGETYICSERHILDSSIFNALSERNIKLIYSNTITNGLIQQSLKRLNCPILCHVHELGHSIERDFGVDNFAAVEATTDFYLAGSLAVANYLTDVKKLPKNKVELAYPFIDVASNLLPDNSIPNPVENASADTIIVGACGTIGWRKGTDLFIQVARLVLAKSVKQVHFVWLGGPITHSEFMRLQYDIEVMGIKDNVTFTGPVPQHVEYFKHFDIFVLPSREDPYPMVMLDAASLGIPVICFDKSGGAPEFIEDDAGVVVPYLDVGSMANSVIELCNDDGLRIQQGKAAQVKVLAKHDITSGGTLIGQQIQKQFGIFL